ncbi:transketolase family protein [candidate division TA06 bacterium]|nr:transketolase family protein [candidate division TA06 bacterium]
MVKLGERESTRNAYGVALAELGEIHPEIVALDADLAGSTQTRRFADKFPERFFEMGISEADMMCTAAGLAVSGKIPFVSTFVIFGAGRAWEQIRNTICRPNLPVRICLSHGGISIGEDGSSAQACEDFAIMRSIPNISVIVPCDAAETKALIHEIWDKPKSPVYIRMTRNKVPTILDENDQSFHQKFTLGKAVTLREGSQATIIACGQMVAVGIQAAEELAKEGIEVRVVNMSTIKPIDQDAIEKAARETGRIVTVEEHNIYGGLGGAVAEVVTERYPVPMRRVGVRDVFGESGSPDALFEKYGLTPKNVVKAVKDLVKS